MDYTKRELSHNAVLSANNLLELPYKPLSISWFWFIDKLAVTRDMSYSSWLIMSKHEINNSTEGAAGEWQQYRMWIVLF